MCNLYPVTKGQAAIIAFTRAMRDRSGNLPSLAGVFPDCMAPIVRNAPDGVRELTMARWGIPSSQRALFEATTKRAANRAGSQPDASAQGSRAGSQPARGGSEGTNDKAAQEQAIAVGQWDSPFYLAPQNHDLMPQQRILNDELALRPEGRGQNCQQKRNQSNHRPTIGDSIRLKRPDEVLGTDRHARLALFLLEPHPKMPSMSLTRAEAADGCRSSGQSRVAPYQEKARRRMRRARGGVNFLAALLVDTRLSMRDV